ncbi:MAG: beta-lactamase family protein [Planctomycetia bacterium]|nr:beta-lactamase family protein [Planctomycetia bacterium]
MAEFDPSQLRAALSLVEARIEDERQARYIPGIVALVLHDQETVWQQSFGQADVAKGTRPAADTIFRIGSITKMFAATMLMQLRDAGRLQLDDPVEKHLPEFKIASAFPDPRPVTFRQLAGHMAGMPREGPLNHWATGNFPPLETMLASLKDTSLVFAPWTKFKYSNLGTAVLGGALGRIAGLPFREYVTQHILKPLGMHSTYFEVPEEAKARLATGYVTAREQAIVAPYPDIGSMAPAGQLYSTAVDLAKFTMLQLRPGPSSGAQILGGTSLREMYTAVFLKPNWDGATGIGWHLRRLVGETVVGHSGGIYGFSADLRFVPDLKLGFVILSNIGKGADTNIEDVTDAVLEALLPVVRRVQARGQALDNLAAAKDWAKYLGRYYIPGVDYEVEVRLVGGRLTGIWTGLPASENMALTPRGNHQFLIEGGTVYDGDTLAFELDQQGKSTALNVGGFQLRAR